MTPLWDTDNYGGREIFATLGMQWQPAPFHILDFTVGLPVYQYLNGPQLETDYRVMLTWYIEVPTRKSIRYGVITSYSIHYTKLYEADGGVVAELEGNRGVEIVGVELRFDGVIVAHPVVIIVCFQSERCVDSKPEPRITSYNVCYTKLLRGR